MRQVRIARAIHRMTGPMFGLLAIATGAHAQIAGPPGFIYDAQLLASETQSCVAVGPGGTFVGVGPGFSANAQAVVLARESGDTRLVAFGFNSIGDCAYDGANDVLYVTDNAAPGDISGALTGDTVFAVPGASTASGLTASGLELVPAGSLPFAASVTVDSAGDVLVSDAAGGGFGAVLRIDVDAGPTATTFASGFDFASGLAREPASGDVFVAETRGTSFDAQIHRLDAAGSPLPLFAGPSFGFGSYDLAFAPHGALLATGLFGGDVVAFDATGTQNTFASGLSFATGVTANAFTGRVEILSSFSGTDADHSIHRFVPVDRLEPGRGRKVTECVHEFYGLELASVPPGGPSRHAACTDGAPCDADGTANGRCLFPVGFCLNVEDSRTPECAPAATVTSVAVSTAPFSVAVAQAAAEMAAALPTLGPACFFSDGITIPVKITQSGPKPGIGRVQVIAEVSGGAKDADRLRLACHPAP
jgi:hypothetical protein